MTIERYKEFIAKAQKLKALTPINSSAYTITEFEENEKMVVFSAQFIRDEENIDNAEGCWDLLSPNVGRLGMIHYVRSPKDLNDRDKYCFIHEHYEGENKNEDENDKPTPLDIQVDWYAIDEYGEPFYMGWWMSHADVTLVSDLTEEELENFKITKKDIDIAKKYLLDRLY